MSYLSVFGRYAPPYWRRIGRATQCGWAARDRQRSRGGHAYAYDRDTVPGVHRN